VPLDVTSEPGSSRIESFRGVASSENRKSVFYILFIILFLV